MKHSTAVRWLLALSLVLFSATAGAKEVVRIGVLVSPDSAQQRLDWVALADALSAAIADHEFHVQPMTRQELADAAQQRQVDFVLTSGSHYMFLAKRSGLSPVLATVTQNIRGTPISASGGVILARDDRRDIKNLADLRGKTVAYTETDSFGGYLMQAYELSEAGLAMGSDVQGLASHASPADIVGAVLNGKADAGFVPSGALERLIREKKADLNLLQVLNPQLLADFPHVSSTRLYPAYAFAALAQTNRSLQKEVTLFLLGISRMPKLTSKLGIYGFDIPANYSHIEAIMRALRVPPFDEVTQVGLQEVWARYWWLISGATAGMILMVLLSARLISANRQLRAEKAMVYENNQLLDNIIEQVPIMIFLKRASDLRFVRINRAGEDIVGMKSEAMIGRNDFDFFPAEQATFFTANDRDVLASRKMIDISEESITTPKGVRLLHTKKIALLDVAGQPRYLLGLSEDITDRRLAEKEIESLAFYDVLTSLPNRRLFSDRMRQATAASARTHTDIALLLIDLDNFKTINDTLGHEVGDLLLKQVALRLKSCLREGDTASRMGGDEFLLLLQDLSCQADEAAAQARVVAEKIIATMEAPFTIAGHDVRTTASVGATLRQRRDIGFDDLQREADIAMYQAKNAGRNTLRFFDPQMQAAVSNRVALESDLRMALLQDQLSLHYQVQVNLNGQAIGAEALLRWQHPVRGSVSPGEFIPVAEDTGLILPIGKWVLQTACQQLKQWGQNAATAHLTLSVNVSAKQFVVPQFVGEVLDLVKIYGFEPSRLKLELTESLLLDKQHLVAQKMDEIKAHGITFSLDDFGTGYSSLSYLKRLPLDQLKIDQSFVRDIMTDPQDAAIVRTIIALGNNLGLAVIAEGVETQEQKDFLHSAGCMAYQGYFFGRPMPVADLEALLHINATAA